MTKNQQKKMLQLAPSEKLATKTILALQNANNQLSKDRDFEAYIKKMQKIFGFPISEMQKPLNKMEKFYLGGFLEGEGSLSVGAKKNTSSAFGVYFDPAFNITQHVNSSIHLFRLLCHFRTGRIRYKQGSNATLVYEIDTRQTLKEKICPFYQEYVLPCSSDVKRERFEMFSKLLSLFDEKAHLDKNRFLTEIAVLWDRLRMQKGQKNQAFASIDELKQYVETHLEKKKQS